MTRDHSRYAAAIEYRSQPLTFEMSRIARMIFQCDDIAGFIHQTSHHAFPYYSVDYMMMHVDNVVH